MKKIETGLLSSTYILHFMSNSASNGIERLVWSRCRRGGKAMVRGRLGLGDICDKDEN
jgi:hypothetical protein